MKKNFYFLSVVAFLLSACSADSDLLDFSDEFKSDSTAMSTTITFDEAVSIAKDALSLLDDRPSSRANSVREVDLDRVNYVIGSRSRSSADTLLYVINYKDDAGFAVIAANRNVKTPVLAVTESGSFTTIEECKNPGLALFMEMATDYAAQPFDLPLIPPGGQGPEIIQECKREVFEKGDTVLPRLEVNWGQDGIYGKYCSNGIAGCSNTAAAMIMSYFEHPKAIKLTHDNNRVISLDWDMIKQHSQGAFCWYCDDDLTHERIARIMRELGYRSGTDYQEDGSGTEMGRIKSTLSGLNFKTSSTASYKSQCFRNIGGGLYLIGGFRKNEKGKKIGHHWVVEGYKYKWTNVIEYVRPINQPDWEILSNDINEEMFNYFNWGCDGENNGYFNDGVFKYNENRDYKYDVSYFWVGL